MKSALFVSFVRIPLLFIAASIMFLLFAWSGLAFNFPFLPELSTVFFTIVNIFCFYLMYRLLKKEGRSLKQLIGFRKEVLGKDIAYGFFWLFVLYLPFVGAVMGTMFFLFGNDFINQFELVFAGDIANTSYARPRWLLWFAAIVSLIFPFFNAPIEEIMYRGYAQPKFIQRTGKVWIGLLVPSIGFSLQHVMLAPSFEGAIVYATAFFVWGLGSGIIFHRQRRLFPLIICHFLVNIAFSAFPIAFLVFGVY